jgi:two-component system response regulator QseB
MSRSVATLLWIDDDVNSTFPTVRLLTRRGFLVDCAQSATDGLAKALNCDYDAIILDLRLPDGSGLGVLDSLRAKGVKSPIALFTGFGSIATAMAAGQLGASRFLQKPLGIDVLVQALHELICASSLGKDDNVVTRVARHLRIFVAILTSHGLPVQASMKQNLERVEMAAMQPHSRALDAIALIESNLRKGRRPKEETIAVALSMDRAHLGRILARTGLGYRDWKRLLAMAIALQMLIDSDESVSQIAYRLGFDHHSRFDVEFHQTFGMSPRRFRDLARSVQSSQTLNQFKS